MKSQSKKQTPSPLPRKTKPSVSKNVMLGLLLIGSIFIGVILRKLQPQITSPAGNGNVIDHTDKEVTSILLLGYGGPNHDGGYLTDTIMQLVVNHPERRAILISIPRDIAVKIPITDTQTVENKLNAAFAIGIDDEDYPNKPEKYKATSNPGALSKDMVEQITGIPVDGYIAVSFDGFIKAIDTIGGVDVFFSHSFDDPMYPVRGKEQDSCGRSEEEIASLSAAVKGDELEKMFTCRYEQVHIPSGTVHLNGELALKVARSRKAIGDNGDFSRAERQRLIMLAVKDKVLQINFIPKVIPFAVSLGRDIKTDIDLNTASTLLPLLTDVSAYEIDTIALTDDNVLVPGTNGIGQYVLYPTKGWYNWEQTKHYIASESSRLRDESDLVQPLPTMR